MDRWINAMMKLVQYPVANVRNNSSTSSSIQRVRKTTTASHEVTFPLALLPSCPLACSRVGSFRLTAEARQSIAPRACQNNYEGLTNCSSSLLHVIPNCPIRRANLAATLVLLHTAFVKPLRNFILCFSRDIKYKYKGRVSCLERKGTMSGLRRCLLSR